MSRSLVSTSRKRPFEDQNAALVPSAKSTKLAPFCLEQQIASLQAELDHERSLRQLDQKRAQSKQERLYRQLEIAKDEAEEAQTSLDNFKHTSDKMTTQLRQQATEYLQELRQCQIELTEVQSERDDENDEQDSVTLWKEKYRLLQKELSQEQAAQQDYQTQLASLRKTLDETRKQLSQAVEANEAVSAMPSTEEAPPAVMKELNRVRIALAETERRERQALRQVDQWQSRHASVVHESEQGRLALKRLPDLQEQVQALQAHQANNQAQQEAWSEFGKSLKAVLGKTTTTSSSSSSSSSTKANNGPPEISAIQRFLKDSQTRTTQAEQQSRRLQQELHTVQKSIVPLEAQIQQLNNNIRTLEREKRIVDGKYAESQRQVSQLETQNTIYQKEITNLQGLIKTLDELPLASRKDLPDGKATSAAVHTLELSLQTSKDQLAIVSKEKTRLSKELEENRAELERVKDKFGKLRDALMAERAKVEAAEQRAHQAETLAGKGSFNPETTRVLHLEQTPLMEALKEEVQVLKRQMAEAGKATGASSSADPSKLNKRLKENFKEQIALFREGVYLMTGYKIDMLPNTDRPTFRVRSMFGEHEEDHLLLKWPKAKDPSSVKSLDILNTPMAKTLSTTPSMEYMTKFHSLPAFLSSVQLHLFEKQTVMM